MTENQSTESKDIPKAIDNKHKITWRKKDIGYKRQWTIDTSRKYLGP